MSFIPYGRQWIDKEDIAAVVKVLKSDWLTQGPKIKEFEEALCVYTGAKYAVVVSSGTAALHIACLAAGVKPVDEVITSPITFLASANCAVYCGAKPVFADVQRETVNIDPLEVLKRITKRTKAVIPVHFAGHPADIEEIYTLAKRRNITVIEDAAHALGAEYRVRGKRRWIKVGSCRHSDMTVFSFHPVKSITTGEGGAVLTNRKDLYEKLVMLRAHGVTKEKVRFTARPKRNNEPWYYEMQLLGFNYRMTDIQAALGISQLKKLDKFMKERRRIVDIYNRKLSKIKEIELPSEGKDTSSAWHLYPIRLKGNSGIEIKRKKIFAFLRKNGIGVHVHYIPVHLQPYYRKNLGHKKGDYPVSEDYYKRVLTIPVYPKMKSAEARYVADRLKKVFS